MNCIYELIGDKFICSYCGEIESSPIDKICKVPQNPNIVRKALNFISSATLHGFHGNPVSSQDQINDRLSICQTCPLFIKVENDINRGFCNHKKCGCNVQNVQKYFNKLAWKDEKCPLDKWKEVDEKYRTE